MLPIERQNRIKELVQKRRNMKISELSKELNVSEMTIHRDLKPLIEENIVNKTFGGITLKQETSNPASNDTCVYCDRPIHKKMAYRLMLVNNTIEMACCAHCGLLRHRQLGDDVAQAICHDFFKQTTISAPLSWYVMDTSVDMGCCQPQVLTFELKEHADKFIIGFGGNVYSFTDALEAVFQKMNNNHACHGDPSNEI